MEIYAIGKDAGNHDVSSDASWTIKDSPTIPPPEPKEKENTVRVLQRYADKCTMHGPSHIHGAKTLYSRLIWILLFLLCLGFMFYYIISLAGVYLNWPVKQTLTLTFSSLQFPAVTVCNVNPIKASMLSKLSYDMQFYVNRADPSAMGAVIDKLPASPIDGAGSTGSTMMSDIDFGNRNADYQKGRGVVSDSAYKDLQGYQDSWEREAKTSTVAGLETLFQELYTTEDRAARIKTGHQLEDMLLSCSFAGKSCYPDNFTLTLSPTLGNCYTLQYEKFISKDSGPQKGLELVFFLDTDENIRAITPDDGLQVSIQRQGLVPFPLEQGVAVDAGSHALISLNLLQIQRKGSPYGDCADDRDFLAKYQRKYSKEACHAFCENGEIHRACRCRDETADNIDMLMNATTFRPCRSTQDMECLFRTKWNYEKGNVDCTCYDPCLEYRYEKITSSRSWPHQEYAKNVLAKMACTRLSDAKCQQLKAKDPNQLKREFVKLNIFFQDMNYQAVIESADYGTEKFLTHVFWVLQTEKFLTHVFWVSQAEKFFIEKFMADVGGNLALWLGLSLVSVLELLQLGLELARHVCCRIKQKPTTR